MKYKGFVIEPCYAVGSDFTIKNGAVIPRKPTSKDIEYYNILDPMENMSKYCAENSIAECKAEIDRLLQALNMKSNAPAEWAKLGSKREI